MADAPFHELPRLHNDFADWFHLLTALASYAEEAAIYHRLFEAERGRPVQTVLELGSGGGNNASHLKAHYALTLSDLSPAMLALSRTINPELEHIEGDMRSLRLGRTFDAVFAQDAASCLATEDDLSGAIETTAAHLRRAASRSSIRITRARRSDPPPVTVATTAQMDAACATSNGCTTPTRATTHTWATMSTCCVTPTVAWKRCSTGTSWACSRAPPGSASSMPQASRRAPFPLSAARSSPEAPSCSSHGSGSRWHPRFALPFNVEAALTC